MKTVIRRIINFKLITFSNTRILAKNIIMKRKYAQFYDHLRKMFGKNTQKINQKCSNRKYCWYI